MPVGIIRPSNQTKLTNVSIVRMKKGKKRFEIACYKNKVLEWRSRIEKDPDNVLQILAIFTNVNKGQYAPKADLKKAFPGLDEEKIRKEILEKGEVQAGEKERHAQLERVHNEVIDIVIGKLVDPTANKLYTAGMIVKALNQLSSQSTHQEAEKSEGAENADAENGEEKAKEKQLPKWTGVVANKSAKAQALFAMKALIAHQPIPVMRARMKLRISCPTSILKNAVKAAPKAQGSGEAGHGEQKTPGTVKDTIVNYMEDGGSQDVTGNEWEVVGFVEPGAYKALIDLVDTHTRGQGRLEVLDTAVVHEDD